MSSNYLSSLYQEWEMLSDSLSNGLLGSFVNIHDEYNAVTRIYNTMGISEIFSKWLINLNGGNSNNVALEKSSVLADKWREKGNTFFKTGDLENSLKYYNLSVLSAPRNDKTFPLALANRSAVLVRLQKYQEALGDIELALANGYPTDKTQKLKEREQTCHSSIKSINEIDELEKKLSDLNVNHEILQFDQFQSPYDCLSKTLLPYKHSTMEGAGRIVDLKYSKPQGRYVVTTEDVERGQVLFVERPYAFVALPGPNGILPIVCEFCCQTCSYPIPCLECAGSIYCSEKCRVNGWLTFHKWECNGTSKLLWPIIGIAHLALRVLIVASKERFGLKENIDVNMSVLQVLDEINKSNNNSSNKTSGYHRVYNLLTNFDKMMSKDFLLYTLTSVMLTMYLKHHTNFFKYVIKSVGGQADVIETVICCLLLRHLGQMVSSGHSICGTEDSTDGQEMKQSRLATGIFPSASMMNHSCDSNIVNNHHGALLVVRASRNISLGEEVFNCYGPSYKINRGFERRYLLKRQYLFDCECTACSSKEMDNFVDIFNSFKCPQCSESVYLDRDKNTNKCNKCNHKIQSRNLLLILDKSLELFRDAQESQGSIAITKLLEVLKIQKNCLSDYNYNLQRTMDSLARNYAGEGSLDQSISLINQLIPIVKYQYGEKSLEVGHELQKLCDVMIMKLESINDKKSKKYKKTLMDLIEINKHILDIFYYAYGSWTSIYKDTKVRQQCIKGYLLTL